MPPEKQTIPCESSYCLVPALKESIEKAEKFNQDYRKDVKLTLEGIQTNTGQIATYLANQDALKNRVDAHDEQLDKLYDINRLEVMPLLNKKVSRSEMISYVVAAVAISGLLIKLIK